MTLAGITTDWQPTVELANQYANLNLAGVMQRLEPACVAQGSSDQWQARLVDGRLEVRRVPSAFYGNNVSNINGDSPVSNPALRRRIAADRSNGFNGRNGAAYRPQGASAKARDVPFGQSSSSPSFRAGGSHVFRRAATSDATASGVRAFGGAPFASTPAAVPPTPEARSPRVRNRDGTGYWFAAEAGELTGAIKAWARVWRAAIPEAAIASGRYVVLARRSNRGWRLVGREPFGYYDTPEERARYLEPDPRAWRPGKTQASVLMRLKVLGAAETGKLGIPAKRAYRTLQSLEARGLVVGTVTATQTFPSRRTLKWSLIEPEEPKEVAPIQAQEEVNEAAD